MSESHNKHPLRMEMESILENIGFGYHAKQAPPPAVEFPYEELADTDTVKCDCGQPAHAHGPSLHPICNRCRELSSVDVKRYGDRAGVIEWCSVCTVRLAASGLKVCARTECREKAGRWS